MPGHPVRNVGVLGVLVYRGRYLLYRGTDPRSQRAPTNHLEIDDDLEGAAPGELLLAPEAHVGVHSRDDQPAEIDDAREAVATRVARDHGDLFKELHYAKDFDGERGGQFRWVIAEGGRSPASVEWGELEYKDSTVASDAGYQERLLPMSVEPNPQAVALVCITSGIQGHLRGARTRLPGQFHSLMR